MRRALLVALLVVGSSDRAFAQPAAVRTPAVRVTTAPRIDGRLDDEAWRAAPPITDFKQRQPDEGDPVSQPTEVRIVYDDRAIYVAFRCKDSSPGEIDAHLGRRDELQASDWVSVALDTAHDRRAAYFFLVNAAGTQVDGIAGEGQGDNFDWDGIWDTEVQRDAEGWTAEIVIPLSTLRFAKAEVQTWGVYLQRYVNRRKEQSTWPLITLSSPLFVGKFADLEDLRGLRPGLSLQLTPYVSGAVQPGFARGSLAPRDRVHGQAGLDAKYALGGALTLDATINPDFAQVEVDPAVLNLGAFEVFFPEKRAFFLEGVDIFQSAGPVVHTRRIGAPPPQPDPRFGGEIVELDRTARIVGALKLTGNVRPGTSIGLISAYVDGTDAVERLAGGDRVVPATPGTVYSLARVRQALGESTLGGIVTAVNRRGGEASAYVVESDLDLRGKGDYTARAQLGASITSACDRARSPDFHGGCDPVGAYLQAGKTGGEIQVYEQLTYYGAELDLNDLGFLQKIVGNQLIGQNAVASYFRPRPLGPLALTSMTLNYRTNFDPTAGSPQASFPITAHQLGFDGFLRFQNSWEFGWFLEHNLAHFDDSETRKNPLVRLYERPASQFGLVRVRTNDARAVWGQWLNWVAYEGGTFTQFSEISSGVRLGGRFAIGLNLAYQGSYGRPRWVDDAPSGRPLFGDLELRQLTTTLRSSAAITRKLTLQVFAQLLRAAQRYTGASVLDDPYTLRPCNDARTCSDAPGAGALDDDLTSLIVNAVVRWEFLPGSTVFAVYTHNQEVTPALRGVTSDGRFTIGRALATLGDVPADDVIAVKLSYLWSL
jgi:hypothetical protein